MRRVMLQVFPAQLAQAATQHRTTPQLYVVVSIRAGRTGGNAQNLWKELVWVKECLTGSVEGRLG